MKELNIVGAGASGVFLAHLLSGRKDIKVNIFEKEDKILKKLGATGNGRCNFTNKVLNLSKYYGKDKHRLGEILEEFDNEILIGYFEKLGMPSVEFPSGRVYPYTQSAKTLINILSNNLGDNVKIYKNCLIKEACFDKKFILRDLGGNSYKSDFLVLSCGGRLGIRKNDKSNGYDLAEIFGHRITKIFPGIVQIILMEKSFKKAKNLKFSARLSVLVDGEEKFSVSDDTMFTDYGISGLTVLQASNYIMYALNEGRNVRLKLDLLEKLDPTYLKDFLMKFRERRGNKALLIGLEGFLQNEVADCFISYIGLSPYMKMKELTDEQIILIVKKLKGLYFTPVGPKSYDEGQISCGGVELGQISENLESKLFRGLFFTGEILDAQGESGGYNLQWAFSSAYRVYKSLKSI